MKSHVVLLGRVLEDSGIRCGTSTIRDLKTITKRVRDEGGSFLTITLPNFGKDLERALDRGAVDSSLFVGYAKKGCLPAFLHGFTSLIFDRSSGVLLDKPNIDAIQCVRQVSYLFYKIELPCSEERVKAAFDGYIECEQSVRAFRLPSESLLIKDFRRIAALLFGHIFSQVDRQIYLGDVVPKHGPGATADRVKGNAKYSSKQWTERLESVFPAMDFLYSSPRHFFNAIEDGTGPVWLDPGSEPPVRVITVPKTLKTPRIIAIEPVHMQYVQQGLMEMLVGGIERDDNFLNHFIGFDDQETNRTMACRGSEFGDLATLDLSEASDRVSLQHVTELFRHYDWLLSGVLACRSAKADVPGHGIVPLAKFASMGSALTFPVEAMVFLTVIFIAIEQERNTRLTRELITEYIGKVRVFGDDIIVPVDIVASVIDYLEVFGLRVNHHKSFWTGKFRESCGGDYYDGNDVSYVKVRHVLPEHRQHTQEIISAVALRNQLYFAGFWKAVSFLDSWIGDLIPFPTVAETSPALGRHTVLDYQVDRVCESLQRPLVKAYGVSGLAPRSHLDDSDALLKHFLKRGREPFADKKHLERAGRPEVVNIKLRWLPSY